MRRTESTVSKTADRDVVMRRARSFEKKKSTTMKLSTKQLIVTFLKNVPTELKKKKK